MSLPSFARARPETRAGYRFLAVWLAAAFVLAITELQGRFVMERPQTVPLCIWGLPLGALAWHWRSRSLRHFTRTHDPQPAEAGTLALRETPSSAGAGAGGTGERTFGRDQATRPSGAGDQNCHSSHACVAR